MPQPRHWEIGVAAKALRQSDMVGHPCAAAYLDGKDDVSMQVSTMMMMNQYNKIGRVNWVGIKDNCFWSMTCQWHSE